MSAIRRESEEERLHEQQNTRAMCAGVILHALRDFTDVDDEEARLDAEAWLMDTTFDGLEIETELVTFPQACAELKIDPNLIRNRIKNLSESELLCLGAQLRRKKPPEEPEEEEWDDFFPE